MMTVELRYLALSIVLVVIQLLLAGFFATKERGSAWNAGPRDAPQPPLKPLAARLERAARNVLETFPLFAAAVLVAHAAGVHTALTAIGATLYFWGRILYVPLYAFGIPYVRSVVWLIATAGIGLILLALI